MKKFLYLLPLFLGIFACGAQPAPNIADMVNATLTSIAQYNPPRIAPPPTTPFAAEVQSATTQPRPLPQNSFTTTGNLTYFWPRIVPEGSVLNHEISYVNSNGFTLTFINPSVGAITLMGGVEVTPNCDNNPGEPVTIRGLEDCYLPSTGAARSGVVLEAPLRVTFSKTQAHIFRSRRT